jgi:hypothetical protein
MLTKRILTLIVLLAGFFLAPPQLKADDTPSWTVKSYGNATTYSCQITYASDSLATNWLSPIPVADAEFQGEKITLSWRAATGTTKVFNIHAYLSNFLKNPGVTAADTTYLNISQSWDTTGNYTAKPVHDTVNAGVSGGASMQWLYIKTKGAANNREDVVLDISVTVYKKE